MTHDLAHMIQQSRDRVTGMLRPDNSRLSAIGDVGKAALRAYGSGTPFGAEYEGIQKGNLDRATTEHKLLTDERAYGLQERKSALDELRLAVEQGNTKAKRFDDALKLFAGKLSVEDLGRLVEWVKEGDRVNSDSSNAAQVLSRGIRELGLKESMTGDKKPSSVAEWEFFNSLTQDQQRRYLVMKRANPYLNLGDVFAQPDPTAPGTAMGQFGVGLPPGRSIDEKGERVITTPAIPGAGREQMFVPGGGLGAPGAPTAPGPVSTPLPPSPVELRKTAERKAQQQKYADVVLDTIDRAESLITDSWFPTAGLGSLGAFIPGTPQRDLAAALDTIRSSVGFERLQEMRAASPTGGALGQVSDLENKLLQAALGSLDQAQSKEQLLYNLARVRAIYQKIIHEGITSEDEEIDIPGYGKERVGSPAKGAGWKIERVQ